jgi:hypothetical protein
MRKYSTLATTQRIPFKTSLHFTSVALPALTPFKSTTKHQPTKKSCKQKTVETARLAKTAARPHSENRIDTTVCEGRQKFEFSPLPMPANAIQQRWGRQEVSL